MVLKCEKCGAMYILSDEKLKAQNWSFKCTKCQHETTVKPPEQTPQQEPKLPAEETLPPEIQKFSEQLKTDPKSKAFMPLAEYYFKEGKFEQALEILDGGLKNHPGYLSAHVLRGRTLFNLGRVEEAVKELEEVCNQSKENTLARKTLARSYESLGAYDKAENELEIVLMLDAGDKEAKQMLEDLRKKKAEQPPGEEIIQEETVAKEETGAKIEEPVKPEELGVDISESTKVEEAVSEERVTEERKTDEFADIFESPEEPKEEEIPEETPERTLEEKGEPQILEPPEGVDESVFEEPITPEGGVKAGETEIPALSGEDLFSEEAPEGEKMEESLEGTSAIETQPAEAADIFGDEGLTAEIEHAELPEEKADFPVEKEELFPEVSKQEGFEETERQDILEKESEELFKEESTTFQDKEQTAEQVSEERVEGFDTGRFDEGVTEEGVIEDVFKDESGIETSVEIETEIKETPRVKEEKVEEETLPQLDEEVLKAQRPKAEPVRPVAISISSLQKEKEEKPKIKPIFIILPLILLFVGAGAGYYYWTFEHVDPETASVDKLITISKGIIKSGEKSKLEAERFYTEAKVEYNKDTIQGFLNSYEALKKAIAEDPHNPTYFALMADVSAELGVYKDKKYLEESNKLAMRAQAMSPDSNDSARALGHYYKAGGRKQEAIEYLNKAISIKNDDIYATLLLADILSDDLSGLDKAEELVNKSLAVKETPLGFYILGKIYEQRGLLNKAIEFYNKNLSDNHAKSIVAILRVRDKDNSYEEAEKVIKDIYPKIKGFAPEEQREILLTIANLQLNNGKLPEAKQSLEAVIKLSPNDLKTYELLGDVARRENKLEDAASFYEKALQLDPKDPEINYRCGRIYIQLHKYTQAINKLKLSVDAKPEEYKYRNELGNAYVLNGQLDEGINELKKALEISPKGVEALYNLVNAYLQKKMTNEALELAQRAVASDPYSVNVRLALSKVYFKLNKVNEAKAELEKIINLKAENSEPYKFFAIILLGERDLKKAEEYAEKAIKLSDDADSRSIYGKILSAQNRYEDAIDSFKKAIEFEPYNHKHYYDLGEVYFKKKDYESAFKAFQSAVSNNPADVPSNYMIGVVLEVQGKFDDAYSQYEKIVTKIDNKFAPAYFRMGMIAERKGDNTKAVSRFQNAVDIDSSNAEYLYHLGRAFYNAGDVVKAKENLEKAVKISPENSDIHFQLGVAYDYLGETKKALLEFEQAYKLNSSNTESLVRIANIYRTQGEYDKAMQLLTSAMKRTPTRPTIYYSLGMLYEERGELEKAIASYKKALEISPDYPDPYYSLGFIYFKLGRNSEAKESFKKTLSLGIDSERAKKVKSTLSKIP